MSRRTPDLGWAGSCGPLRLAPRSLRHLPGVRYPSPGPPHLTLVHDGAAPWVFGSTCLWLVFPVSYGPHGQAPSLSLPGCQDCSGVTGPCACISSVCLCISHGSFVLRVPTAASMKPAAGISCASVLGEGGPKPQGMSEPSCPRKALINLQLPGPSPRNTESEFPR